MLNSLSLNHGKLFIWPTPKQTVCQLGNRLSQNDSVQPSYWLKQPKQNETIDSSERKTA